MSTDIFLVGLAGLSLIAILIVGLTSKKTKGTRPDRKSSMMRDGRSS